NWTRIKIIIPALPAGFDRLLPFPGFFGDRLAEIRGRTRYRHAAETLDMTIAGMLKLMKLSNRPPQPPRDKSAVLTYAIGDIHGCYLKLRRLLGHCAVHCGSGIPRFIFIGDYVDRGPNSAEVVRFLMKTQASAPNLTMCLRGNHEAMLIDAAA